MIMSDLQTSNWRPWHSVAERNDGPTIVERDGYRSVEDQVMELVNAGELLREQRRGLYDFESEEDVDDALEDPTRTPNYDMADASEALGAIDARRRAAVVSGGSPESHGAASAATRGVAVESGDDTAGAPVESGA